MATNRSNSAKITGPAGRVSVGDLRWLVNQLQHADEDYMVKVMTNQGFNQMDPGSTTLSAEVPEESASKRSSSSYQH